MSYSRRLQPPVLGKRRLAPKGRRTQVDKTQADLCAVGYNAKGTSPFQGFDVV